MAINSKTLHLSARYNKLQKSKRRNEECRVQKTLTDQLYIQVLQVVKTVAETKTVVGAKSAVTPNNQEKNLNQQKKE